MDAVRTRFGSLIEWVVAAAFLGVTVLVGSLILRELRAVTGPDSEPPGASLPVVPSSIPPRAISVPMLLLLDGKEIHVGDTAPKIAGLLGKAAQAATLEVDRGPLGERQTRFYEYAGTRFILVFEPFERLGEPRVGAIYLH